MERPVMKKNAYVTIIASPELSEMRLDELVGRRGLVVEDLPQNRKKNRGGLVLLEEIYMDEFLWFIPEASSGCSTGGQYASRKNATDSA